MQTMTLTTVDCPYCASADHGPWGTENGYSAVKCSGCGLVFVSPRPADETISEANRLGQHQTETGQLDVAYSYSRRKIARYRERIREVFGEEIAAGKPLRWLDVGAGYGEMVTALQQLLPPGSEIVGIEPMQPKVATARARGLPVVEGGLDTVEGQFDVVSLINVLSHLPDPDAFLAKLAEKVKPGGVLVLVTGNGGDLASAADYPDRLDLPDHLLFAGRSHVAGFLERHGLKVEKQVSRRLDGASFALKSLIKKGMGRPAVLILPYRSPFRDMLYKARRAA